MEGRKVSMKHAGDVCPVQYNNALQISVAKMFYESRSTANDSRNVHCRNCLPADILTHWHHIVVPSERRTKTSSYPVNHKPNWLGFIPLIFQFSAFHTPFFHSSCKHGCCRSIPLGSSKVLIISETYTYIASRLLACTGGIHTRSLCIIYTWL